MDQATKPSALPRLPRARVTLPLLAIVAAALAAGPILNGANHPDEAAILGMASARGIQPVEANPEKGTKIYQWDPEISGIAPWYIGAVKNSDYVSHGQRYTLVKRPGKVPLYLAIRHGEMRYWIRKP